MTDKHLKASTSNPHKTALVCCWSNLERDPRVLREIDWLISDGWVVDTLGLGKKPLNTVRTHFAVFDQPGWASIRILLALLLVLRVYSLRSRVVIESRIPPDASKKVRRGDYDIMLLNDIDLLPWAIRNTSARRSSRPTACHLDLHEYHPTAIDKSSVYRSLVSRYQRWLRGLIASPAFTSRTTVAEGISELYSEEFGIPRLPIVRNCPPYVEQTSTSVDPNRIQLVFHGGAAWERGLRLIVEATALLDERFVLNLMLNGSEKVIEQVKTLVADVPNRISFVPPVPMEDVAVAINAFDLEVIFYPPADPNLKFALPNKFFEAIQGRLGLVTGPSPSMVEVIQHCGNGAVTSGWAAGDLADTLRNLTAEQIDGMKEASGKCAAHHSAEAERQPFLDSLKVNI